MRCTHALVADDELHAIQAASAEPLEEADPAGLVLFHAPGSAQNLTKTVLIHGNCHQNSNIFVLSAPVAAQVDAVHVDVWIAPAPQGAVPPVLDVDVGFLVQLTDGSGRNLAAPQCLRDVLHPRRPGRHPEPSGVHSEQPERHDREHPGRRVQHLYGLPSLRRTAEEVSLNVAYRWFLGYTLQEETPHFSTVSYNFRHRFTEETVDRVFAWILDEVAKAGYLSPKAVFIDGTHIKANANTKKQMKEQIPAAARHYAKELMEEVNADREAHDKKPFDDDNDPPASPKKHKDNTSKKKLTRRKKQGFRTVTKSVTDPDCGLFVKGEHKRQFAYEAHTACDKNGFVLETVVTPGNVHDSVAFDEVYDKVTENFPQVEAVVADAAYKTPHICKKVFDDGRVLSTAYKRPQTMKNGHEWWKYVYDEFYNCVICPEYQPLKYSTTNRDGYREYKSDPNICAACPTRERCTHSKDCIKTVQRHIWKGYEELADDARYTPAYAQLYKCRKETIERVFADAKEKHAMRYTQYRGLAQVTNWVKLKFAAMNLKKLATWKWRNLLPSFCFAVFSLIYVRDPVCS